MVGGGGGMRPNTATSRSFACFCFYDLVNNSPREEALEFEPQDEEDG